ncbi:hypothetical protein BPAE_0007g00470 [Botrytis paeoniae]|uniref:Uncharacterized protein n=1 Tax=Botrytis paeoniae TaxID=278948 RepID=A0A4Z1G3T5_9HELO|nr:hypothetical protein BPAE_0007g00470 [Botrytis paeoniae]
MNGSSLVAPMKQVVDINSGPEWSPQDDHAFSSENPLEWHLDSIVADEKLEQASEVDAERFSGQNSLWSVGKWIFRPESSAEEEPEIPCLKSGAEEPKRETTPTG